MSPLSSEFVLPRPGAAPSSHGASPIPGPTEATFTKVFGALLPKAKYLDTTNGKAAYYEILPSSTGPLDNSHTPERVVFLHGVQTPALGLLPLLRALHASFPRSHFVLVDLWGHGLSDTPIVPHDSSLFHQLIDALLDKLEWPSAHFVGYSLGGMLTVGYTTTRSSRVQSFALVAPAGLIRSSEFTAEEKGHLHGGGDEAAARKWVVDWLEGGERVVPADWKERVQRGEIVAEALREWQSQEHPGHVASVVGIVRDSGVTDSDALFATAARSGIPSVVVLGAEDDICDEQRLNSVGLTNVHVVQQTGHAVVREKVPEVAALIGEFWTKTCL